MNYPQNLAEKDLYWYNLIQECRTSGKSDMQWLAENNIKSPTFYYHIKQLRKKACEIPDMFFASTFWTKLQKTAKNLDFPYNIRKKKETRDVTIRRNKTIKNDN